MENSIDRLLQKKKKKRKKAFCYWFAQLQFQKKSSFYLTWCITCYRWGKKSHSHLAIHQCKVNLFIYEYFAFHENIPAFLLCYEYSEEHLLTRFMGQLETPSFYCFLIILFCFCFCLALIFFPLRDCFSLNMLFCLYSIKANFLKKRRIHMVTVTLSEDGRMLESF